MATRKKPVKKKAAPSPSLPLADGIPVHCAHDKIVKRDELRPNPRNPNQHPESQIELLAKVIKTQGWRAPITVSLRSGLMVRGHGRLLSAERMGVDEVPVDFQNYDTDADEWADLLADNRIAELAEPDFGVLRDLLVEMDTGEIDMDLTGFDEAALEEIMTWTPEPGKDPPEDPGPIEPPAVPQTKTGDLWLLGEHRLLCGDSTDPDNVARLMDDQKAVIMNTDPPYGIDYVKIAEGVRGIQGNHKNIENDELTGEKLQTFLENAIRAAVPHLQLNAAFYLWHPMLTQGTFFAAAAAAAAADILIHRQIIWIKPSLIMGRGDYHWRHELCFYGWQRGNRPPFYGPRNQDTIWEIDRERGTDHPTQKPLALFERPIRNHSKGGEIVYEPFAGSGSQCIAAEQLNRRCYGIEIDPGYCDVICHRWAVMTGQTPTLEDGTPFVLEG